MTFHRTVPAAALAWAMWSPAAHAQAASPETPTFVQPTISDPMLAPPEAAPGEVRSWDEALGLIRRSPDFLTSVAAVERAVAQHRIALAAVLPQLGAVGSYTHNFNTVAVPFGTATLIEPPVNVWAATVGASWNVINPRSIYEVGTADLATEVARLSLADRRRVIAGSVVSAMLSTLAAGRVAELDRVGLRAALERLVLTQTRLKFARGTELDVDRASQDVAAARALLISGDESLRQSREALGQVLGSTTPLAAPADLDIEGFERAIAATCHMGDGIERRADVAAARERVAIAQRQINDAKLLFSPSVAVNSQLGYASAVTLGPLETWTVGAALVVPLYDGGARYGAIRDARAAAEQAQQSLTAVRIDAVIEASRASRAVSVDTAARDVAKQQRDLAARIDERTRQGYASGLGTSLDLVTSAQALRQAEINLVLLEFEVAQARAGAVVVNAECLY
jgi:outer membrane protein, multidrug efflux system